MEQAQPNSLESRAALAKAAQQAPGHPLLLALESHLSRELESLTKTLATSSEQVELYRAQGRYEALGALRRLLKRPTTA